MEYDSFSLVDVNWSAHKIVDCSSTDIADRYFAQIRFGHDFVNNLDSARDGLQGENFTGISLVDPTFIVVKRR